MKVYEKDLVLSQISWTVVSYHSAKFQGEKLMED